MATVFESLKNRLTDVANLNNVNALLEWDLQTYMPPGGATARSEQVGLISRLSHEMFIADETSKLIERAEAELNGQAPDSDEVRLLRNARRDYDKQVRIPTELASAAAQHAAYSQEIWARCRAANDFATFAPLLERTLDLTRRIAAHLGYKDDPYDALLDLYEPEAKTADIAAMFEDLKPKLIELTHAITSSPNYAERTRIPGGLSIDKQNALTREIVKAIGYDFDRGRQDQAPHPFCTNFSVDDVRITTRFEADYLPMALYASMHEAGHALYEQGIAKEYDNSPLGGGASMGVHESQSRLWENLLGRSRSFVRFVLPKISETFPAVGALGEESFYRAVNRVEPSLIRVEADEVTYNLHVLLRFELERELLADRLKVRDLPAAWNARMQQYLGVTPPDDATGVLQDVHWSAGMFGYFPTYTLGNLLSGQLWHTIRTAIPELELQIERGEFQPLLGWLRENIHRHGRKYLPDELIRRATGEPLVASYYVDYLQTKFGDLYQLT